jgi:hypothetical protein
VLSGQFDWGGLLNVGRLSGNAQVVLGYMLGRPSPTRRSSPLPNGGEGVQHPALLAAISRSENATGADNQQGSPRDPSTTTRQAS